MEQHLKHIKYLETLLSKEVPQSNEWWNVKNKLDQVRIAWAQSWNLAVITITKITVEDIGEMKSEELHLEVKKTYEAMQPYFYDKLTAPLTLGLKESYENKKSKKELSEKEQILEQEI